MMGTLEVPMRLPMSCLNASCLRIFSLLLPVGPPLGLGIRDERAWEQLVQRLS
jgi:hypothetical protein